MFKPVRVLTNIKNSRTHTLPAESSTFGQSSLPADARTKTRHQRMPGSLKLSGVGLQMCSIVSSVGRVVKPRAAAARPNPTDSLTLLNDPENHDILNFILFPFSVSLLAALSLCPGLNSLQQQLNWTERLIEKLNLLQNTWRWKRLNAQSEGGSARTGGRSLLLNNYIADLNTSGMWAAVPVTVTWTKGSSGRNPWLLVEVKMYGWIVKTTVC